MQETCVEPLAEALRLALATVEARHAQRGAWWRELTALYARMVYSAVTDSDMVRAAELRKRLGLEEK
jgi:hypothetical protein